MKLLPLVLTGSLLANAGLIAALALRSGPASPATSPTLPTAARASASATQTEALRAALASGDAAALEAAGLAPAVAREIALGRIFARFAERARAAQSTTNADARWWRNRANAAAARAPQLAARRELTDALIAAFGDDFGVGGSEASQFSFLPAEKRDALRRIVQDYDEMMAKFSAAGVQLPSDKEKLRLLKAERERDIAALLNPDERLAYEMRTSSTGQAVRNRYGDAIETEEDFRKLYALQKAFEEKFPLENLTGKITAETLQQRAEAQRQLQQDIRAALGDDKYASLRRASDGDLRNVDSLVSRLNLPPATTDRVAATRDTFAAESQRINGDTALTPPQRRAQLQELAGRAKTDLTRTLGAEAADAYAQSSPWVGMLQNGMAFSTAPQTNSPGGLMLDRGVGAGVFPVLPAGATGGVNRQVIMSGPGAGGDAVRTTDHVMTFTTSAGDGGAALPAGKPMIIVTPPPADTAPQPKP